MGSMVCYTSCDTGKAPLDLVGFAVLTMQVLCNGSGLFVGHVTRAMTKDIKYYIKDIWHGIAVKCHYSRGSTAGNLRI